MSYRNRFCISEGRARFLNDSEIKAGKWCNLEMKMVPRDLDVLPYNNSNVCLFWNDRTRIGLPCLIIKALACSVTVAVRDIFSDDMIVKHISVSQRRLFTLHPIQALRMSAAGRLIRKYILRWREHLKYKIGSVHYEKARQEFESIANKK